MKRFVFELEPVLRQRERSERECQVALGEAERVRADLERRLREVHASATGERDALRDELSKHGAVRLGDVRLRSAVGVQMLALAQRLAVELAGAMERSSRARAALARATASRRAVELLRERRHEAWKRERLRREVADLDEVSMAMRSQRARASRVAGGGA